MAKCVLGEVVSLHRFLSKYALCDGDIVRIVYLNRVGEFNEICKITAHDPLSEFYFRLENKYRFIACNSIDDVYCKNRSEDTTDPECRCFILLEE